MSEYVISNAKIYSEDQVIESGYVHICHFIRYMRMTLPNK